MSALYLNLDQPDRSKTQIMYQAKYFPDRELSDAAERLICWRKKVMLYKSQVTNSLTEDMTAIIYTPKGNQPQRWNILWEFNAIPTQLEWERKSDSYIIQCRFRVLIDGTKIALLSF